MFFAIDQEKLLTVGDNYEIPVHGTGRPRDSGREIQKPGAVIIHHIGPRECALNKLAVERSRLTRRKNTVAVESNTRHRRQRSEADSLTFELNSESAFQCF